MYIRLKHLVYFFITLVLAYFLLHLGDKNQLYYSPNEPPVLYKPYLLFGEITDEMVDNYQKEIVEYIRYLEEYYTSTGMYFDRSEVLPTELRYHQECRLYDHIFKDVRLPEPPKGDSVEPDIDMIITRLSDHISDLRARIKDNNAYMAQLRYTYRNCFN